MPKVENSSNVLGYEYDEPSQTLVVEFKSGKYAYKGVPPAVNAQIDASQSKGKFISANIKGIYPVEKVG